MVNNFGQQRSGSTHQGEDIVVIHGAPVYAVAAGTLTKQFVADASNAALAGNAWRLTTVSGSYYFYAHLAGFAPGLFVGAAVRRGDVIGFVGDTGDAGAGNFHLHFEVHPNGGVAVDPLTLLDVPGVCTVLPHQY